MAQLGLKLSLGWQRNRLQDSTDAGLYTLARSFDYALLATTLGPHGVSGAPKIHRMLLATLLYYGYIELVTRTPAEAIRARMNV